MRKDAYEIINSAIESALPHTAVKKALEGEDFSKGKVVLVSIGKAAWSMADATASILKDQITKGIVITKYDHSMGDIPNIDIHEAGHPISDSNSYFATQEAIKMVSDLSENDKVIFLISGGGSALFEDPLIDVEELKDINEQLLASGANIVEINTIRKRLSRVKGGRFALLCQPAQVLSVVLSDIIDDPLDMIASGPAYPDNSTAEEAMDILLKYDIDINPKTKELLNEEMPQDITNVKTKITGSVNQLCDAAVKTSIELGYKPIVLTSSLNCEASEAGKFLGAIAKYHKDSEESLSFIAGGETIVRVTGTGKGGRNQEIALAAADEISGIDNTVVFSVGSDGTDGPTDAAGGLVDSQSQTQLLDQGINIYEVLNDNDSYHALQGIDGLVMTGPTGTNVNDLSVLLIRGSNHK